MFSTTTKQVQVNGSQEFECLFYFVRKNLTFLPNGSGFFFLFEPLHQLEWLIKVKPVSRLFLSSAIKKIEITEIVISDNV